MAVLPDNVTYGYVTGRFLVDAPEDVPGRGKVRFVPGTSRLQNMQSTPPTTIVLEPVLCELDIDGDLIDSTGAKGVSLVATNNVDINPSSWTWSVQISVTGQKVVKFNMALPGDTTVDLTTVVPVDVDTSTAVTVFGGPRGAEGDTGPAGIVTSDTPPADTTVLWADTTVAGTDLPQTVNVFTYTDETDARPNATVVFWIPDPYTLPNPFAALPGDLVLRTTPDVLSSATGLTNVEHYTVSEYDAIITPDPDTVYLIVADP